MVLINRTKIYKVLLHALYNFFPVAIRQFPDHIFCNDIRKVDEILWIDGVLQVPLELVDAASARATKDHSLQVLSVILLLLQRSQAVAGRGMKIEQSMGQR